MPILAALIALAGCGGGSSPMRPPPASVNFTPTTAIAPANSVTIRKVTNTDTTVSVDVVATGVTEVASVAFDLVFNPAIIKCNSATVGPFLSSGGATVNFLLPSNLAAACSAGRLPVGITIIPAVVGVSGSGALCNVTFEGVTAGSDSLRFENAATLHPLAVANPGVIFEGGTVTVIQ